VQPAVARNWRRVDRFDIFISPRMDFFCSVAPETGLVHPAPTRKIGDPLLNCQRFLGIMAGAT
jgi:hypothetical protein